MQAEERQLSLWRKGTIKKLILITSNHPSQLFLFGDHEFSNSRCYQLHIINKLHITKARSLNCDYKQKDWIALKSEVWFMSITGSDCQHHPRSDLLLNDRFFRLFLIYGN